MITSGLSSRFTEDRTHTEKVCSKNTLADLGYAPYGPKFSQFHAVLWKIWQNHMLASSLEGRPPRGILDPPLEQQEPHDPEGNS